MEGGGGAEGAPCRHSGVSDIGDACFQNYAVVAQIN